ncbi:hypothetical protein QQS21_012412 [Conoideocrella luteorostrata]|uniref:Uncharacterized protein n=1 Tax=Conoideocrella luteorostrata TaxID=1105319 RepID=A0AAJ0CB86_9HYPO|nr:hypothetical protein QQS21_012412 [Conoideocrella luteorostrata]
MEKKEEQEEPMTPVRILVITATHLVPGDGYLGKTNFIRNVISQQHWNRASDFRRDRFTSYNAQFGFDNRTCYFLVDHGENPGGNDDDIPVLWYRWTGDSLVSLSEALPSKIRKRLKKIPFTLKDWLETVPREVSDAEYRRAIRSDLYACVRLSDDAFRFLETFEHASWLEKNVEERFWSDFKSQKAKWIEKMDQKARGMIGRVPPPDPVPLPPRRDKEEIPGPVPAQPRRDKEKTENCTGMWDCECYLCD